MNEPKKKRGGGDTARQRGWAALLVHLSPAEKVEVDAAARAAGLTTKEYIRRITVDAARDGRCPVALPPLP